MSDKKQQLPIPRIYVRQMHGAVFGRFGDYKLYDSANAFKPLNSFLNDYDSDIRFKDVCIGPYIDFDAISGKKTRSVDDCLVVCEPDDKITVYDQITLDNTPRKINWFDRDDKRQPIFFEPRIRLFAKPKVVSEPKYKKPEQSFAETTIFNIIQDMGFDEFLSDTGARFFKPLPRIDGKTMKDSVAPDSAFLIRSARDFYSWYKIYSDSLCFEVTYFKNGEFLDSWKIGKLTTLVKALKEDRERRNNYIKWQYSR